MPDPAPPHDAAHPPGVSRRGTQRILVVEDEQIVALDLQLVLEDMGYIVIGPAASAEEARLKAGEDRPDLVLMDVRIEGDADGIQTAAMLRAQHQVPIVYLTGNADDATLTRALATEPDGYLAKPFDAPTLRATIEVALRRHTLQMAACSVALRLRREATVDPLTGLYNRRQLDASIDELIARGDPTFAVVLLDLDRFKQINDRFGHPAGDAVLHDVACLLRDRLRIDDVACRYGGEELAIIIPGASLIDAAAVAERLRGGIAELAVRVDGAEIAVTASFGVAEFPQHGLDGASLLRAADTAVYAAKRAGRNRVVTAGRP